MKIIYVAIATAIGFSSAVKAAEEVKPVPRAMMNIRDCLGVLDGLGKLDSGKNSDGKMFKLAPAVRDAIGHDMFMLSSVQQEGQAASRRAQTEVRGETPGELSQLQLLRLEQRLNDYLDRPCLASLEHIKKSELDLDHNEVPSSVLANLWRIIDK
jgi:hypothetical protein